MCFRASRLSRKSTPSGVTVNWKATAWCASAILWVAGHLRVAGHLGGGRRVCGQLCRPRRGPAPGHWPRPQPAPLPIRPGRPPAAPRPHPWPPSLANRRRTFAQWCGDRKGVRALKTSGIPVKGSLGVGSGGTPEAESVWSGVRRALRTPSTATWGPGTRLYPRPRPPRRLRALGQAGSPEPPPNSTHGSGVLLSACGDTLARVPTSFRPGHLSPALTENLTPTPKFGLREQLGGQQPESPRLRGRNQELGGSRVSAS